MVSSFISFMIILLRSFSCVFHSEVSVQILHSFFFHDIVFLLLSLQVLYYILDINPLSGISYVNISPQPVICLFVLLTGSFEEKFLTFGEIQIYCIFSFTDCIFGVLCTKFSVNSKL